jgi:GDP-L-fucose synthase
MSFMQPESKIYVAGHTGLVGGAITRQLQEQGYTNLVTADYPQLDLIDQAQAKAFFDEHRPEFVFLAAAKVGGIVANSTYPGQFYYENVQIQNNVIHNAYKTGIKRLLFLGSSCIYPKLAPQPMKEEHLLTGSLEPTNRAYAIAKIGGIEQCWGYNRQYGTRYIAAMPTNLYGPGDNYDLQNSHVMPAMIRKMHTAKTEGQASVTLWGTGRPYREFLFNQDLAVACVYLLNLDEKAYSMYVGHEDIAPLVNIGSGIDLAIKELAETVAEVVGFDGELVWDTSKPDGTPRKLMDSGRIFSLGWLPKVNLKQGIAIAYEDFKVRYES